MKTTEKKDLMKLEAEIYRDYAEEARLLIGSLDKFNGKVLNFRFRNAIINTCKSHEVYLNEDYCKYLLFASDKSNHSEPDKNGACLAYYPENRRERYYFAENFTDSKGRIDITCFYSEITKAAKMFECRAENLLRDIELVEEAEAKHKLITSEIALFTNDYSRRLRDLFGLNF